MSYNDRILLTFFNDCCLASVNINVFMVLTITGKTQMAKEANDAVATKRKK